MKNLALILAILLLIPVFSYGQNLNNLFWTGCEYDINPLGNTVKASMGFGKIIDGNLWTFNRLNVGQSSDADMQVAYIVRPFIDRDFYIGGIAGPGVDWINYPSDGEDRIISYITASTGVILGYDITERFGAFGYGNYNFTLDGGAYLKNGADIIVGVFARF